MISRPIYPYIPFAGALVWNRSQATEAPAKVHASFTPDWFAARMDLDMGERWHTDAIFRRESFVKMAKTLNAEFPKLRPGGNPNAIKGDFPDRLLRYHGGPVWPGDRIFYERLA